MTALTGCSDDDNNNRGGPLGPGASPGSNQHPASGGVADGFAYETHQVTRDQATHIVTTADEFHQAVDAASESSPVVA